MSNSAKTEDLAEVALVVRCLVRLRHHQTYLAVEHAVKEAAGLEWRFCQACGAEVPHDHGECAGCGFFKARTAGQKRAGSLGLK